MTQVKLGIIAFIVFLASCSSGGGSAGTDDVLVGSDIQFSLGSLNITGLSYRIEDADDASNSVEGTSLEGLLFKQSDLPATNNSVTILLGDIVLAEFQLSNDDTEIAELSLFGNNASLPQTGAELLSEINSQLETSEFDTLVNLFTLVIALDQDRQLTNGINLQGLDLTSLDETALQNSMQTFVTSGRLAEQLATVPGARTDYPLGLEDTIALLYELSGTDISDSVGRLSRLVQKDVSGEQAVVIEVTAFDYDDSDRLAFVNKAFNPSEEPDQISEYNEIQQLNWNDNNQVFQSTKNGIVTIIRYDPETALTSSRLLEGIAVSQRTYTYDDRLRFDGILDSEGNPILTNQFETEASDFSFDNRLRSTSVQGFFSGQPVICEKTDFHYDENNPLELSHLLWDLACDGADTQTDLEYKTDLGLLEFQSKINLNIDPELESNLLAECTYNYNDLGQLERLIEFARDSIDDAPQGAFDQAYQIVYDNLLPSIIALTPNSDDDENAPIITWQYEYEMQGSSVRNLLAPPHLAYLIEEPSAQLNPVPQLLKMIPTTLCGGLI